MMAKPTRGRRRLQMLCDLTKGDGYVILKRAAEEMKGYSGMMSETCSTADNTASRTAHKSLFHFPTFSSLLASTQFPSSSLI